MDTPQYARALRGFEKAVANEPENSEAWYWLGMAALKAKSNADAQMYIAQHL